MHTPPISEVIKLLLQRSDACRVFWWRDQICEFLPSFGLFFWRVYRPHFFSLFFSIHSSLSSLNSPVLFPFPQLLYFPPFLAWRFTPYFTCVISVNSTYIIRISTGLKECFLQACIIVGTWHLGFKSHAKDSAGDEATCWRLQHRHPAGSNQEPMSLHS